MQDMLKKIISVDKKAKETVEEAKREQENVEKKLAEAKIIIESEYEKRIAESIEKTRDRLTAKFEEEENRIKSEFEEKKRVLEETFSSSTEEWAKKLVERVLDD